MTSEEFKQSEIIKNYLPPFGGPYSDFDKGCAHGYSEGFDAALKSEKVRLVRLIEDCIQAISNGEKITDHRGIVYKQEFGDAFLNKLKNSIELPNDERSVASKD